MRQGYVIPIVVAKFLSTIHAVTVIFFFISFTRSIHFNYGDVQLMLRYKHIMILMLKTTYI